MTSVHRLLRVVWFFTRPRTLGVRALAITPDGRIVLLKHSYAPGWYLPGGGLNRGENAETAMLRELHEEIGLTGYESIEPFGGYDHRPDYRRDHVDVFLVTGACYAPQRSWEIEEVAAFDRHALPQDTSPNTRAMIKRWLASGGG